MHLDLASALNLVSTVTLIGAMNWETRRHWHTEEFGQVVGEIIAKGNTPKAFATYNLREIVAPKTGP